MTEKRKIRALIVDDMPADREYLSFLLNNLPSIELVAHADNVDDAITEIKKYNPDLVFLDVQMPVRTGFDLVKELQEYNNKPRIIFVTAFEGFAIEALRNSAFDYLVKPINFQNLADAISRLENELEKESTDYLFNKLVGLIEQPLVYFNSTSKDIFVYRTNEVMYCEANGPYTHIYCDRNKKELASHSLADVLKKLGENQFIRVSRSHIVNKNYIYSIDKKKKELCLVKGDEKIYIGISRNRLKEILSSFQL